MSTLLWDHEVDQLLSDLAFWKSELSDYSGDLRRRPSGVCLAIRMDELSAMLDEWEVCLRRIRDACKAAENGPAGAQRT